MGATGSPIRHGRYGGRRGYAWYAGSAKTRRGRRKEDRQGRAQGETKTKSESSKWKEIILSMLKTYPVHMPQRVAQRLLVMLLLGLTVLVSACGGDPRVQQSASQNKAQLDTLIQHAQQIGVPASLLQPIL